MQVIVHTTIVLQTVFTSLCMAARFSIGEGISQLIYVKKYKVSIV